MTSCRWSSQCRLLPGRFGWVATSDGAGEMRCYFCCFQSLILKKRLRNADLIPFFCAKGHSIRLTCADFSELAIIMNMHANVFCHKEEIIPID